MFFCFIQFFKFSYFQLSCLNIELDKFNLSEDELESIMEMNLDIDTCDDIQCITNLHITISQNKNDIVKSINDGYTSLFIGVENIGDLIKKYSSEVSKAVFFDIAKSTNKLKFYINALKLVEDKMQRIRSNTSNVKNKMI